MTFRWNPREHLGLAGYALKWLLIGVPLGAAIGSAVAGFLWCLERATELRWRSDLAGGIPWLLFLLPAAGVGIGALYHWLGKSVEGGNDLIIDQIHEPGGGVPARLAPLVLIGTVITHLFGGSAGREGTAVQIAGSIASTLSRPLRLNRADTRTLLMCGVAAGFGAVFGTPLSGAVFAVEVLAIGQVDFAALTPCLIASIAGDMITRAWGIHHTPYSLGNFSNASLVHPTSRLELLLLAKVALAAGVFGLASVVFAELSHSLQLLFKRLVPSPLFRPALGGMIVIALALLVGADYLGLGVTADPRFPGQVTILSAFHAGGATAWSWLWKTLLTAATLASGFKGGEVTPLFFIGATLGNTLARLLNAPTDLFAALGFVGVFAGATNTPLACTIMGIELFAGPPGLIGSGFVVYLALACFVAYLISGHSGIYLAQRIGSPKLFSASSAANQTLRHIRDSR